MAPPSINEPALATVLRNLAARVSRLAPSHRDPDAFHEAKSEIEAELRHLSRVLPPALGCGRRGPMRSLHIADLDPKLSERK